MVGRGLYYAHITIDPTDENRIYSIGMQIMTTIDAGRTWKRIANTIHGDYHTVWVDPKDPNRVWIGEDGGIAVSYDRGANWESVSELSDRPVLSDLRRQSLAVLLPLRRSAG